MWICERARARSYHRRRRRHRRRAGVSRSRLSSVRAVGQRNRKLPYVVCTARATHHTHSSHTCDEVQIVIYILFITFLFYYNYFFFLERKKKIYNNRFFVYPLHHTETQAPSRARFVIIIFIFRHLLRTFCLKTVFIFFSSSRRRRVTCKPHGFDTNVVRVYYHLSPWKKEYVITENCFSSRTRVSHESAITRHWQDC